MCLGGWKAGPCSAWCGPRRRWAWCSTPSAWSGLKRSPWLLPGHGLGGGAGHGGLLPGRQPLSFWCLLAGGILYTVGAALYGVGKKIPYIHPVFHLFVLGGSVLHTISVWAILQ